jgi:hypothetical protein
MDVAELNGQLLAERESSEHGVAVNRNEPLTHFRALSD